MDSVTYPNTVTGNMQVPFYHEKCPNCGYCPYCKRKDVPFKDHWNPETPQYPWITWNSSTPPPADHALQYKILMESLNNNPRPQFPSYTTSAEKTYVTNDSKLN